jgi:hypothetical protein
MLILAAANTASVIIVSLLHASDGHMVSSYLDVEWLGYMVDVHLTLSGTSIPFQVLVPFFLHTFFFLNCCSHVVL